ncbi:unnamed protein product [Rotaria sp. Silwood2]|nr:unnamed protein product [Rotaria sp. Silwood2]CAF2838067.1 unnamed protein product [Rotaria sp. Silwood2]CAF3309605.1 unnamed protein product [Rotaria sp. Silwood2]CAF3984118.1 unnamed protein product [Rotaria sp. Silwood2]CAF4187883.1 unnamed protein product [Rotaria sp. Silwood2]
MALDGQQKPCGECKNGVVMCVGCEKRFCWSHIKEHRQKLDKQMDDVVQEHNQLREVFNPQGTAPHHLSEIDKWEQKSINIIKDWANQVRADLQAFLDRTKHRLSDSFDNMTKKLKSSQSLSDYTEKELDEWMRQLEQLRQMFEKPLNIDIVEDAATSSSIRMIKVIEKTNNQVRPIDNAITADTRLSSIIVSTGE